MESTTKADSWTTCASTSTMEANAMGGSYSGESYWRMQEQSDPFGQQVQGMPSQEGWKALCKHHLVRGYDSWFLWLWWSWSC
mmetsp:Transcript_148894/g.211467  ORF Transcript_148894/g.211467 Transcript_148894/m.211467 type:complete len:82 (+) Transcript_148894:560-805(+)